VKTYAKRTGFGSWMNGGKGSRDPEPTGFREFRVGLSYRTTNSGPETKLGHAIARATGGSVTVRIALNRAAVAKVTPPLCMGVQEHQLLARAEKAVTDYLRSSHWPITYLEDDGIETTVEEL
jgi:hypothetical protein